MTQATPLPTEPTQMRWYVTGLNRDGIAFCSQSYATRDEAHDAADAFIEHGSIEKLSARVAPFASRDEAKLFALEAVQP